MDSYKNAVRIAAHRGNSKYYPENTLIAFRSALTLPVDQLEIDLHMSKDGHIVMMHDHAVDRTTNGTGLVRDLTLAQLKELDAGSWKGEQFAGERIPTFIEFLEMLRDYPEMTVNVELKDYPTPEDPEWARVSADKSIALIEQYGLADRIWINCWSGELLEYIDEKYSYMHCLCLFGKGLPHPVRPKADFDFVASAGVEPWCYFPGDEEEYYDGAIANGVKLLTCNDPKKALDYLRKRGLHE